MRKHDFKEWMPNTGPSREGSGWTEWRMRYVRRGPIHCGECLDARGQLNQLLWIENCFISGSSLFLEVLECVIRWDMNNNDIQNRRTTFSFSTVNDLCSQGHHCNPTIRFRHLFLRIYLLPSVVGPRVKPEGHLTASGRDTASSNDHYAKR